LAEAIIQFGDALGILDGFECFLVGVGRCYHGVWPFELKVKPSIG
jgi:hypothetical protein